MRVVWTRGGVRSLQAIRDYIDGDNPIAARTVAQRIRQSVRQLEIFPQAGRPALRSGTREIVIAGLPYVVVYRLTGAEVQVIRVFHTKQNRH